MDGKEGSKNFLIGFLVGAASTLPGISGGVVAVLFRVYERLIDDVSHIRTKLKEDFWFLLTIGLGILIGLVGFLYVTKEMMTSYGLPTMFFFVGLIIGQLPDLVKITKKGEPVKTSHIVWLSLGLVVMMVLLFLELNGESGGNEAIIENSGPIVGIMLAFFVGALFSSSKIIPGISGSTVLLALGLYLWMINIVTGFELLYLIPFTLGFLIMMFVSTKVMSKIIEKHHHPLYYFIVGLTVGSVILVTVISYNDHIFEWTDVLIGLAAAIIGIAVSMAFGMMRRSEH
ncbi:MAG: DUF368 domain-containing protein [Methanomassiliicoccaceae archaeon]|nr:DUF368 domain-containing protein [Methanomassiliicoccaceae archaeon]